MQFKAKLVNKQRGAAWGSASTSTPNDEESREAVTLMGEDTASAVSPWQAETIGRKGKEYFRQQEGPQDPPTSLGGGASSPFNNELADKLKARQGVLAEAEAQALALIKQGGQHDPSGPPVIAANASAELSDKLKRQQQALKVCDEAIDISSVLQHATAAGSSTFNVIGTTHPVWSNPASPFGAELAGALQRRAVAACAAADGASCSNSTPIHRHDAAAVMTPSSSHSLAAGAGAGGLNYRETPTPFSLGTPGSSSGTPAPGSSSGTPAPGSSSGTPAPGSSSGTPAPGSSSGTPAPGSELAEIMRQRQARAAAAGTAQFSSQQ
ncbi:hypothetical protein CEUSTIGMA_g9033.t1 [Chlamydomonas eustigma]|uniref:Uncharacterized protein n=1 Tax=Chlamydomonas eustigma TaxID=1157962 RepID=A0A250XEV3_9CHLO|nr:hypothetical protein CEUSTIGMA_g9033.t1 [Chlamydomonas eustigma]|eukprot:GAX81605.1 hypothetical protein CEUSTIGMA_g9033.t1 [Chlamydomonas eustigma]